MSATCLLLGATGLVGARLLDLLVHDAGYRSVIALGRRAQAPRPKVTWVEADLGVPDGYRDDVRVDHVYCCLGTTIKKAGSEEAFRRVDFEYPLEVAKAARAAGARRYVIVTAVGAHPKSAVFYNRVKGEVEAALADLAFPEGLKVVRPSILLGERGESRPAERVASALMRWTAPAFAGPLKRYRAIDADLVARAMHRAGRREPAGDRTYEGGDLFALAEPT